MTLSIRVATAGEVPILSLIRTSVRENHMTLEELREHYGVTEESLAILITTTGRAFIGAIDGEDAGFSIADASESCIFGMFVLPEFEGRGLGRALMAEAEGFLHASGCDAVWLEAGAAPGIRAHGFYAHLDWRDDGTMPDGQRRFVKRREELARGRLA